MNEQITADQLRVIGADGAALGILSRREAMDIAREQELDLVEVSATSDPPVVKIQNYAKEMFRAEREARKRKHRDPQHEVKEIQLWSTTEQHDLETKAVASTKFLNKGHRVRVVVKLRGRLAQRPEMAEATLERFCGLLEAEYVLEHRTGANGRISVVLRPGAIHQS